MDSIKSCKITVGVSDKNHVDLSFLPVKMKDKTLLSGVIGKYMDAKTK